MSSASPYLCTPCADITWHLDTINQEQINALLEHAARKFTITYGSCATNVTRLFKGCQLTNIIEPTYTIPERFTRWIGSKFNITCLYHFHEKHTSYEFSVESVEYL